MSGFEVRRNPMSTMDRLFDVLDLFSIETPTLRVEDVSSRLGYPRTTSYRCIKALTDGGLIAPVGDGTYALGPRVLELERLMQLTDPLLHASQEVLGQLAQHAPGNNAFLVCSLYRDRVLCIHHAGAESFTSDSMIIPIRRARGLPFPLFKGAASLAILASLPPYRIRSLYLEHEKEVREAGLATNWTEFRQQMKEVRKTGYAISSGQISPHLTAIAAPVTLVDEGQVVGSLCRIMLAKDAQGDDLSRIADTLIASAAEIGGFVKGRYPTGNAAPLRSRSKKK
jgi:DNA-binding IclR family transcriptional regulator